ncbi:erythromycin esterase family protein [Robertkochia sediminum]|uniref:erythromycin esterase family protein n=1 Tax=Robertkochia sediminum TaxID=2785326 RepID=UPI0019324062|nr:erythromycin esterase family protein [Robertkochia sediminum]MBL7473786.1 erythromycin esterase family protein [Robertkochia sediminum]
MKFKLTILFCLFTFIVKSQELQSTTLLPPESKEISDLTFLEPELKDKQVVMLGEQTHMYGNIFEMKARIVEYLHQELGFTTIAMESSMYDIWKMNKNGFDPKVFNNAIWGVWSSSLEFQRLVNYIDDNNLKVIGFDSQINNVAQFIEDFFDYLETTKIALKLDEDDFGIIIEGVLDNVTIEEEDIKYKNYEKELKRIIEQLNKLEQNDINYHWKQFTKSLLACSQDAHNNTEEILTNDFGNKNNNIRDKQMADNLLSYIKRNPNEKIICWADNIHIINDNSSIKKPIANEFVSMGSYIHKELKDKSYSLATIHANDSLIDLGTKKWHKTPIKKNSFEYELSNLKLPYLFVSSDQDGMGFTKATRLLNFIDFTEARLDQLHDGYLFIQKATLPKLETKTDSIETSAKQLTLTKKIEQIQEGQSIVLKGQILNKKTNQPVPFANLILKKEEIFRVADENGNFELPVRKQMMQTTLVTISSLGFETLEILLDGLNEKVYLKPKFVELDEVVITGYLSPLSVLKNAITKKEENHPVEPFNFFRYGKVLINSNDKNQLDLELITKDEDEGYQSPYIITQRVEQIKWNVNKNPKKYKYSSQFFAYRQNAIRYANILHKRKYKKFKLNFVKSNNKNNDETYIIAFETERNKWNYTNRSYPTKYSGKVYINKDNFAIVKVIENWETTLKKQEIKKHFKGYENYTDIVETTIKEENICVYSQINNNDKYYATQYFRRRYSESINNENIRNRRIIELDSHLYDFELKDVEDIEYEWREKDQTVLNRVKYDETFWSSFYEREIDKESE